MTQLCRNVRQIELRGIAIHDRKTWSIMRAKDAIAHNRPGLGSSPRGSTKKGVIFRCHRHRKLLSLFYKVSKFGHLTQMVQRRAKLQVEQGGHTVRSIASYLDFDA